MIFLFTKIIRNIFINKIKYKIIFFKVPELEFMENVSHKIVYYSMPIYNNHLKIYYSMIQSDGKGDGLICVLLALV